MDKQMLPGNKPQMNHSQAVEALLPYPVAPYPVVVLGIRGYFKKTLGNPAANDRGIYDDAIFIVTPSNLYPFNGNTDPSVERNGIATLIPGMYMYRVGMHAVSTDHPYEALRQYGRVTVKRDGGGVETDTAAAPFYIDIHRGGYGTTSSLGCQTIHPDQWPFFIKTIKDELAKYKQVDIPYVLIEY